VWWNDFKDRTGLGFLKQFGIFGAGSLRLTYLEAFDLPYDATPQDIKIKYHKLARQYHPDKPGGSNEKFKVIGEIYENLQPKIYTGVTASSLNQ